MRTVLLAAALLLPVAASRGQTAGELGTDEVAWIDNAVVITTREFDRYLATVEARKQEGQQALLQVLQEAIVRRDARAAGLTASEAEVSAALGALEESTRSAGGLTSLMTADVDLEALREAMRLHVLQEQLVRAANQLAPDAPVSPGLLQSWLDARVEQAALKEASLEDEAAATWIEGTISKVDVGARLRAVLPRETLTGVLNEMVGVQLVRRRAAELDIDLTPAEVTREVLLRDTALKEHANGLAVSYVQYLQQVEHRTLQEHIQSDAFCTEVLVRLITEHLYTEEQARAFWEQHRDNYKDRSPSGEWTEVRLAVWKDMRQIVYKQLFTDSSIVRRY